MADTSIEWTDATWNPVAGCTVLSPGCTNCYAMRMAARLDAMGMKKYRGLTRKSGKRAVWTGKVRLDQAALSIPAGWKKPRRIFVNSMSDLFHEGVPSRVRCRRLARDAGHAAAHVSNSDEATGPDGGDHRIAAGAAERVARDKRRERQTISGALTIFARSMPPCRFVSFEPLLGSVARADLSGIHGQSSAARAARVRDRWRRNGSRRLKPRVARHGRRSSSSSGAVAKRKRLAERSTARPGMSSLSLPSKQKCRDFQRRIDGSWVLV